jgi:4'-phosphopantetheinyl transferase
MPVPGGASTAAVGTVLSRDEISRWRSFAAVEPANLYLLSRLMLYVLTHCHPSIAPLGWCFAVEATGRPRIDAVPGTVGLHFSISHCQRAVAIAVASVEGIGVDVESTDVDAGMATALLGQLHTSEVQELPRQRSDALNTRHMLGLWTLKEAYLKAIGTGLSVPPKTIAFDRLNRLMPECRLPPENAGRLWDFCAPEVPMESALALPSRARRRRADRSS